MDIVDPRIEAYMGSLLSRHDEAVLLEMEEEARGNGFPIIGRMVGATVEVLARSVGARRVFELGSGYGYSALVAGGGRAAGAFRRRPRRGKALATAACGSTGDPVAATRHAGPPRGARVVTDRHRQRYPGVAAARERIRVGGLYLCDNVLWYGRVTEAEPARADTRAILEHNALIADDERYLHTIVPTRDGLMVALRVS
jgi:predicted O-methyltransferase YrrM